MPDLVYQYLGYLFVGQADYFGHIPNLAARVSGLAAPGQILLECSPGFSNKVSWIKEGAVGLITSKNGDPIELKGLGNYYLKGFDDNTKLIFQVHYLLCLQLIIDSYVKSMSYIPIDCV